MPLEIERKFLIKNNDWQKYIDNGTTYIQGYIFSNKEKSVRARIAGEKAFITIKANLNNNTIARYEYEYEIPLNDAQELLDNLCSEGKIEKTRYKIKQDDLIWEIDVFKGDNQGLILAEVELPDAEKKLLLPDWIGEEVTSNPLYLNSNLAKNPYKNFN